MITITYKDKSEEEFNHAENWDYSGDDFIELQDGEEEIIALINISEIRKVEIKW